jgi:hypothetical protein
MATRKQGPKPIDQVGMEIAEAVAVEIREARKTGGSVVLNVNGTCRVVPASAVRLPGEKPLVEQRRKRT